MAGVIPRKDAGMSLCSISDHENVKLVFFVVKEGGVIVD